MGVNYLWDSNTVIYYLQQQLSNFATQKKDEILVDSKPTISVITEIELLSWRNAKEQDLELLYDFIQTCWLFELEQSIRYETATIRKHFRVKLPDAIIAATALSYDLTLITRNTSDFKKTPSLKLLNLFE
ncbi:type II toxin-antitoxin system VapC family toxin [soil metagenome]